MSGDLLKLQFERADLLSKINNDPNNQQLVLQLGRVEFQIFQAKRHELSLVVNAIGE